MKGLVCNVLQVRRNAVIACASSAHEYSAAKLQAAHKMRSRSLCEQYYSNTLLFTPTDVNTATTTATEAESPPLIPSDWSPPPPPTRRTTNEKATDTKQNTTTTIRIQNSL